MCVEVGSLRSFACAAKRADCKFSSCTDSDVTNRPHIASTNPKPLCAEKYCWQIMRMKSGNLRGASLFMCGCIVGYDAWLYCLCCALCVFSIMCLQPLFLVYHRHCVCVCVRQSPFARTHTLDKTETRTHIHKHIRI